MSTFIVPTLYLVMTFETTSWPSTATPPLEFRNPPLDIFFGVACITCFVFGTLGNLAAFTFFKFSTENVPHTIYKIITLADMYICACVLPVGACYLMERSPGIVFGNGVMCHIWGYIWNICGRMSIFLVVVLSTTRTLTILRPFYLLKIKAVVAAILVYILLLLTQLLVMDFFQGAHIKFDEHYADCGFYANPKNTNQVLYFIGYIIPFIVPMFIVIISCAFTIYAIAIKPRQNDSHTKAQATSSARATMTILIFTLTYSIFNIPLVFDRMIMAIQFYSEYNINLYKFPYSEHYLNFTYSISIAINSALNPWLYLWRMHNFRRFLLDAVKGLVPPCLTKEWVSYGAVQPMGQRHGSCDTTLV